MLPPVDVNFLAVLAAGVSAMILGFLWYGPLFSKPWMKLVGLKEADLKKGPGIGYLYTFIMALFLAFVLKHFLVYAQSNTLKEGLVTGLWIGLGFVVTTMGPNYVFTEKPLKLAGIDIGYQFVNVLVMSAILTLWP